jgi:hypothetical protein
MAVATRPTMHQVAEIRRAERREEYRIAVAQGRVTVRQMTVAERKQADRRFAAREADRAAHPLRSRH